MVRPLKNRLLAKKSTAPVHITLSSAELSTFRTKLCDNHQNGMCKDLDSCPNSHCLTWQRRNPFEIFYSPKLCPDIQFVKKRNKMTLLRRCNRGRLCVYAHSKEEELYHPLKYKTKMCSSQPCCYRYYCPFAHSLNELRRPLNDCNFVNHWRPLAAEDSGSRVPGAVNAKTPPSLSICTIPSVASKCPEGSNRVASRDSLSEEYSVSTSDSEMSPHMLELPSTESVVAATSALSTPNGPAIPARNLTSSLSSDLFVPPPPALPHSTGQISFPLHPIDLKQQRARGFSRDSLTVSSYSTSCSMNSPSASHQPRSESSKRRIDISSICGRDTSRSPETTSIRVLNDFRQMSHSCSAVPHNPTSEAPKKMGRTTSDNLHDVEALRRSLSFDDVMTLSKKLDQMGDASQVTTPFNSEQINLALDLSIALAKCLSSLSIRRNQNGGYPSPKFCADGSSPRQSMPSPCAVPSGVNVSHELPYIRRDAASHVPCDPMNMSSSLASFADLSTINKTQCKNHILTPSHATTCAPTPTTHLSDDDSPRAHLGGKLFSEKCIDRSYNTNSTSKCSPYERKIRAQSDVNLFCSDDVCSSRNKYTLRKAITSNDLVLCQYDIGLQSHLSNSHSSNNTKYDIGQDTAEVTPARSFFLKEQFACYSRFPTPVDSHRSSVRMMALPQHSETQNMEGPKEQIDSLRVDGWASPQDPSTRFCRAFFPLFSSANDDEQLRSFEWVPSPESDRQSKQCLAAPCVPMTQQFHGSPTGLSSYTPENLSQEFLLTSYPSRECSVVGGKKAQASALKPVILQGQQQECFDGTPYRLRFDQQQFKGEASDYYDCLWHEIRKQECPP